MGQRVILNLGQGSWLEGFPTIIAQLGEDGNSAPMQILGSLPGNPELAELHRHWQSYYTVLHENLGLRRNQQGIEIELDPAEVKQVSIPEFEQLCETLEQKFNEWLSYVGFAKIERSLGKYIDSNENVKVIIEVADPQVRRFAWQLWSFFDDYPNAELLLSAPEYIRPKVTRRRKGNRLRILAVVGNATDINVQQDLELLNQTLKNAEIVPLQAPSRQEFNNHLWDEKGWDILFFAGHSQTQISGLRGKLELNSSEDLSIAQLKNALRKAIKQGLQLAIFNSCEGLGLAWELEALQIPQVIVMREPIPDAVAQTFLKYFLPAFSTGKSLSLAVREAREKLQGLEGEYPCASWLPVICQNPAMTNVLTWRGMETAESSSVRSRIKQLSWTRLALATLLGAGLTIGIRQVGWLQNIELKTWDRMMVLRPNEGPDKRLLLITVTEDDVRHQLEQLEQQKSNQRGSLTDSFLEQLLNKLNKYQPRAIGLDVYHDWSVDSKQHPQLRKQFSSNNRFITICLVKGKNRDSVAHPPDLPTEDAIRTRRVGFSDVPVDDDRLIRRQYLGFYISPKSICKPKNSLSLGLALLYLEAQGIKPDYDPERQHLKINNVDFPRLGSYSGGYQRLNDNGYQLHLNYRSLPDAGKIAKTLTLQEALANDALLEKFAKDRVVLIGTTAASYKDFHPTPYGEDTPGVVVQAHMVSQLLSAVLDKRPLLSSFPEWGEAFLIVSWTVLGALVVRRWTAWQRRVMVGGSAIFVLWVIGYGGLIFGIWLPLIPCTVGFCLGATAILAVYRLSLVSGQNYIGILD